MASPFNVFRSNLKPLMVALTLLALFAFVVLPAIQMYQQNNLPGTRDLTVASYKGGKFDTYEVEYYQRLHGQTNRFLAEVAKTVADREGIPRVPNYGMDGNRQMTYGISPNSSPQTVVVTKLFAQKALDLGMELDDTAIQTWLDLYTDGKLTANELAGIRAQTSQNTLGQSQMFGLLRTELLANLYERMLTTGLSTGRQLVASPIVSWHNFLKINQEAKATAYPVLVEEYIEKAGEPNQATIDKLFAEGKDREPDPNNPEPGFRKRYTANIEFVAAHFEDFLARETEKFTEEELRLEYDRRVKGGDFVVPENTFDPAMNAAVEEAFRKAQQEVEAAAAAKNQVTETEGTEEGASKGEPAAPMEDEPPATEPPATEPPATEAPATEPPATEPPATEPPATEPPATEPPATEPPATEPPATEPPATEPPATEPPATEPPATEPPATEPPATEPPATEPPATEPPATEPPATEPPATEPPATEPPATEPPVGEVGSAEDTGNEDGSDTLSLSGMAAPLSLVSTFARQEGQEGEQPPAETPAADPAPVTEPQTTESPETPAEQTPTEPATTEPATTEPQAAEPTTSEPPATEATAVEESAPAGPKPFEDVKAEIARTLATPKARAAYEDAIAKAHDVMRNYFTDIIVWESDKSGDKPTPPSLETLAQELGLRYGTTGMGTILDVYQTPLGRSFVGTGASGTLAQVMYSDQRPPFNAIRTQGRDDLGEISFSAWKTEAREGYVPELSEVRDEVIQAAKLAEARELAEKAAREIADKANASPDQPLADFVPETRRTLVFENVGPFPWMVSIGYGYRPFIGSVTELDNVGEDFMRAVFTNPVGEFNVASNIPKSVFYVTKATEITPSAEQLRLQFMDANQRAASGSLAMDDINAIRQGEAKNFEEEIGLEWNEEAFRQK